MVCVCVFLAATAAGLTMGLVSMDPLQLKIVLATDVEDSSCEQERQDLIQEKMYANAILPLVQQHHLLLVALLLFNSLANEALPIFLDQLVPSYIAVILSVTLVLLFGEIIPSAIFTGKNQLKIGAQFAPLVRLFMLVTFPVSYPMSKCLDCLLGEDHMGRYRRAELKALIKLHRNAAGIDCDGGVVLHQSNGLNQDEIRIIHGVLECKEAKVEDVMVTLDKVFMLDLDEKMDSENMARIMGRGKSRIPVYEKSRHNIRGMLIAKQMIALNPDLARPVRSLGVRQPLYVRKDCGLLELLGKMQRKHKHFAVACDRPDLVIKAIKDKQEIPPHVHMAGIITIEDVLERMLKEAIEDEIDSRGGVRQQLKIAKRLDKLKELVSLEKKQMVVATGHATTGHSKAREKTPIKEAPSTFAYQITSPVGSDGTTLITTVIGSPNFKDPPQPISEAEVEAEAAPLTQYGAI
eukprot:gb/GEZN01003780.1/.p1 GENE.gb/GEZN01003780.1/~~gb/GEZN01003780.1/.p1  ORF type:complete len:521 (-),score=90.89 gb/GEZN01003780.1/:536-1927(-)